MHKGLTRVTLLAVFSLLAPLTSALGAVPKASVHPSTLAQASGSSSGITFDHANLNDPVRMVGEPDIQIDNRGGNYVSGPGGSTTQASWFWKSEDNGIQWHLVGCPAKANCQNGGGDTEITLARNRDVFASDLQTLQCNSTFRSYDEGNSFAPGEGCFPETDRQWMDNYDPNASATGRRIYLAANYVALNGCYMLVSTDNGITYQPPNPAGNPTANIGADCIGRFAVDKNNGDIFVPTSGGRTFVSTNGGMTWQGRGTNGAEGHFFAPIQIDTAGNLWQGWTTACTAPATTPCKAFISYSTDRGFTWHTPIQVNTGPGSPVGTSPNLRQMLFPWITVGDPGRINLVFYGTTDTARLGGFPGGVNALWHIYSVFSTNAMSSSPDFTQVQADEHVMHRGTICTGGFPGCLTANADRSLADFFMVDKDPDGRAFIAYNENSDLSEVTPGQFIGKPINAVIRLRTGPSLFAAKGNLLPDPRPADVAIKSASLSGGTLSVSGTHGLPPGNWSSDPEGDASFPVVPVKSQNHPALDVQEVAASDDGTNLTFKMKLTSLSPAAIADAQTLGNPSWLITWWEGKAGIGPASMTSGPLHSHWFMKWLGGSSFVCGKVSSIDAPALGAPTPKVLTYAPSANCSATGSVNGNTLTISAPLSQLGGLVSGDKIDHVTGYGLAEHAGALADEVDQAKTFSFVIGTPAAAENQADGYVQVSLDPNFGTFTTATLDPLSDTWTASIPGAPDFGFVYARQFLSKDLYTSLWDDVQAGPVDQFAYPSAPPPSEMSFAHPTMAGINGDGFEADLRPDPTTPSTMYMGVPGASSANTSWIWKTTDSGKTWRWVTNAEPENGKVQGNTPHCLGGGDTEIAVDKNHHIYFNDLSGVAGAVPFEFSTGRSDDGGANFVCDTAGVVPDAGVDRQFYALIGDPTLNGGDQVDQNTLYLTNNVISAPQCPGTVGNILAMYRSPIPSAVGVPTPNPDAGLTFGPHFLITCDDGIMGNNEVSPVASKRAENGALTLPNAVHQIFVPHDNRAFNKILVARCFPVPFGVATANTSDPSGLRCVDKLVANLAGTGRRTGANFPALAIDKVGNLYVVWEEKVGTTQTLIKMSYSLNEGETWSTPITLPNNAPSDVVGGKELGGPLNTNVMAWPVAGDDGRVDVVWYGTNATGASPDQANGYYSLWMTQSLNAHDADPIFSAPVLAGEHFTHKGTMNTLIGNQSGDRAIGDFLNVRMGPQGEAVISYADSNNATHADTPHAMFARQITGPSLLSSVGSVNISGLKPDNSVTDPTGDAKYQAAGQSSANAPNLDITGSSIQKVGPGPNTTSACPSTAATGCYRVKMDINNMSLADPPLPDHDKDLVWLTQWLIPSSSETLGGKNLFVYAEWFKNDAGITCFTGQNNEFKRFFSLTYPGTVPITNPASCAKTDGPGGNIVITVPLSTLVSVAGPIDRNLHEVRAPTITQPARGNSANSDPTGQTGIGLLFNEIDGAQTYVFKPQDADLSVTKSDAPDPVGIGDQLSYTITVHNAGPDPAPAVTVTDSLPSAAALVSATPSQGSPCNTTPPLTCVLGTLAPGNSATVDVLMTAPNTAQTLTNTASVSTTALDLNSNNNSATTTTEVTANADVAIAKLDAPLMVAAGETYSYTIKVFNFGPAHADEVRLNNTLPPGVTLVSSNSSQGSCSGDSPVSCFIGTLESGETATVVIEVRVPPNASPGTLTDSAFVTTSSPDPNTDNNSATANTTLTTRANLSVVKQADRASLRVGGKVTYTMTITNSGPSNANAVKLTDAWNSKAAFVSFATDGKGTCVVNKTKRTLTCNLSVLPTDSGNNVWTITLVLKATATPSIVNTATVTSSTPDPSTPNTSKVTTKVKPKPDD